MSNLYSMNDLVILRKILKKKLISNQSLHGYSLDKEHLLGILKRTISLGESDSVLVIAPRGCGKSALVTTCLKVLRKDCGDDFVVVQLNGLIHTDDNLALREIIQQLHMDELNGDLIAGSFADNLMFVLQSLKSGDKDSKAIVFILDEFQLFCNHRNQTLLYNLFDVAQTAQAPVCVVGLTCRVDITELLEKRVKSRFSHRQIFLAPNRSLEGRLNLITELLTLDKKKPALRKVNSSLVKQWNSNVKELLMNNKVVSTFKKQLYIDLNERALRFCLFCLVTRISISSPFISEHDILESFEYSKDDKIELIKDLSVLEVCLIIAMKHQVEIYDDEPFNFEMIIKRYLKFSQENSSVSITQRPILLKAFERIKDLEIILPLSNSTKNQKKEYLLYHLILTKSQIREGVKNYPGLPTDVSRWASSDLI